MDEEWQGKGSFNDLVENVLLPAAIRIRIPLTLCGPLSARMRDIFARNTSVYEFDRRSDKGVVLPSLATAVVRTVP